LQFHVTVPVAVLAILSLGILVLTAQLVRVHRRRRRELLERDLQELAVSRKLNRLESRLPGTLVELARGLGGQGRHGGLQAVLWGQDKSGSWYLCRRRVGSGWQQALLFENKFLTVRDLNIVPLRPSAARRWNPLRRFRKGDRVEALRLQLRWESPAERVDERSVRMVQALYLLMADARKVVEPFGLHLQVHDQRVAVHTRHPLDGDALRVFLDVALELRRQLSEVPRRSGALRLSPGQSGKVSPVEGTITRALKVVGHPNDVTGPTVPYGAMVTDAAVRNEMRRQGEANETRGPGTAGGTPQVVGKNGSKR